MTQDHDRAVVEWLPIIRESVNDPVERRAHAGARRREQVDAQMHRPMLARLIVDRREERRRVQESRLAVSAEADLGAPIGPCGR